MDYDVVASKERLTGRAYFNPGIAGGLGITSMPWLDLGNIQMMSLDYGIKRKEHFKARRGILIADRYDAYSATPRWEITGDEFVTSTLSLIFLGTVITDFVQGGGGNVSTGGKIFNVHKGGVLDLGRFCVYNYAFIGGSPLLEGRDFIVDAGPGKLYIPLTSTMSENAQRAFGYQWPAITFNKILPPLSNLNRIGTMQLIEEDDSAPVGISGVPAPKTVHDFPVSLSTDSGGQTKVDDYKQFKMFATITDPTTWSIRKRNT